MRAQGPCKEEEGMVMGCGGVVVVVVVVGVEGRTDSISFDVPLI